MDKLTSIPLNKNWLAQEKNNQNMSIAIALSELIDNSISSWIKGDKYSNLEINVIYNDDKKTYEIEDNAYGFESLQELEEGMLFFHGQKSSEEGMNNYGYGMKSAIFWIGKNAEIFTKNGIDEFYGKYVIGTDNDDNVHIEKGLINNPIKTNCGTKIIIKDVYEQGARSLTDSNLKHIKKIIGYRYANYLYEKHLHINLKRYKNGRLDIEDKIDPCSHFTNQDEFVLKSSKIFKNITKDELCQKLEDKGITRNEFPEFYDKFINDESLVLENESLKISDEISIPVKLYINKKPSKYNCGINILEKNRYLTHPAEGAQKAYKSGFLPYLNSEFSDHKFMSGHCKWGLIEIDIDNPILRNKNYYLDQGNKVYYIYPERNKKSIVFNPDYPRENIPFSKEQFDNSIRSFYKSKEKILSFLASSSKEKENINNYKERLLKARTVKTIEEYTKHNPDLDFPFSLSQGKLNDFINIKKEVRYKFVQEPNEYWIIKRIDNFTSDDVINYEINAYSKFINNENDKSTSTPEQAFLIFLYLDLVISKDLEFLDDNTGTKSFASAIEALMALERNWCK